MSEIKILIKLTYINFTQGS